MGNDQKIASADARALLVPQRQLTRKFGVPINPGSTWSGPSPSLGKVVDDRGAIVRAIGSVQYFSHIRSSVVLRKVVG
jgi:hypothetical protein